MFIVCVVISMVLVYVVFNVLILMVSVCVCFVNSAIFLRVCTIVGDAFADSSTLAMMFMVM